MHCKWGINVPFFTIAIIELINYCYNENKLFEFKSNFNTKTDGHINYTINSVLVMELSLALSLSFSLSLSLYIYIYIYIC